jgi:hypothetical protein
MNDLRKAAEMALEFVEWLCGDDHSVKPKNNALKTREALRQALDDKPAVKSYAGGKPNYCTPEETFTLDRGCYERGCVAYDERDGDGVNILGKRVDEMAKGGHMIDCTDEQLMEEVRRRGFVIRDAQIGREWVGLTEAEIIELAGGGITRDERMIARAIEAKVKEKNGG